MPPQPHRMIHLLPRKRQVWHLMHFFFISGLFIFIIAYCHYRFLFLFRFIKKRTFRFYVTWLLAFKANNCPLLSFFIFGVFEPSSRAWFLEKSSKFSTNHCKIFIFTFIFFLTFKSRSFQGNVLILLHLLFNS